MPEKKIPLSRPIVTHDGQLHEVTMREPTGRDLLALGDPYLWQKDENGETTGVPVPSIISAYAERCIVKPAPELLGQLSFADGIRVRDAVLGFFADAMATAYAAASSSSSGTQGSSLAENGST